MNMRSLYSLANYSRSVYIFLSALALLIGAFIYILFRPSEHLFFRWFSSLGLENWFNAIRTQTLSQGLRVPEWMVYSLPNGLWAFGYALLITSIWSGNKSWLKYFWMASIPVLVIGFEVLQYTGTISGTFCIQDIALGLSGLVLGCLVGINLKNKRKYENPSEN